MAVDLLFISSPVGAQPINLVFGSVDVPPVVTVTVSLSGTLPTLVGTVGLATGFTVALAGTFPPLTGTVSVVHDSQTQRPTVGQVQSVAQIGKPTEWGVDQGGSVALKHLAGQTCGFSEAKFFESLHPVAFEQALPTANLRVQAFEDAMRLAAKQLHSSMQEGVARPLKHQTVFQDGLRAPVARLTGLFEDGLHDRRPQVINPWTDAKPAPSAGYRATVYPALSVNRLWGNRFQEARRAPPGMYVLPPVLPPVPNYWGTALLFACPPLTMAHLVFGAQQCVPPATPGALLYILPARFYMTAHTIYAQTLPGLVEVPIFEATVAADSGSYCWSLSATGPASLFEQLAPVGGLPAQIKVTLDGIPFVFAVDSLARTRAFGQTGVRVQGRSVTALISAPYLRATTRANATDMTAQQIALDALATTGIDLDWGVGAGALANGGMVDWLVPAGAWSHQGTPLDAVQAVVQAAGGYLQSHRSAATLLARHPYGQRLGDNPGAPWGWMTGTADVELATDALITEGMERKDGADINGVYVSGTSAGVLAMVKRTASAGDKLAQMVTDPLITHVNAARQRGLSILGSAGHKYAVSLDLPVLTGVGQPGVLDVGQLVQVNVAVPWRARVRSVSVQARQPTLRQTITLERHLETV